MTNLADVFEIGVPASHAYLSVVGACIAAVIERVGGLEEPEIVSYNMQLGVNEIVANIVDHAYGGAALEHQRVDMVMTLCRQPRSLVIELHDSGRSFEPDLIPAPDLDEAQVHGYGLFLVQQLFDSVDYHPQPGGNSWRLVKHL